MLYSGQCKCILLVSWIRAVAQANAVRLPLMQCILFLEHILGPSQTELKRLTVQCG